MQRETITQKFDQLLVIDFTKGKAALDSSFFLFIFYFLFYAFIKETNIQL